MTLAKMRAQNLCEWVGGGWCRDRTQFVQIKVKSSPAWMHKRRRIGGRELQGGEGPLGRGSILALLQIGKLKPGAGSECLSVLRLEPRPRAFCSMISLVFI